MYDTKADRHSVVQTKRIQLERSDRMGGGNVSTVKMCVTVLWQQDTL